MDWLFRFDALMLDGVYQRIVDLFSRRFGIGFIAIAEFLLVGDVLCSVVIVFLLRIPVILLVICCACLLFQGSLAARVIIDVRTHYRQGFVNVGRYRWFVVRVGSWLIVIIDLMPPYSWYAAVALLWSSGMYVVCCQEGPPKQRRQSKTIWLRRTALQPT